MDELDIDELLECEDIEQTAFISSSKQLLSVLDNVINCIDDRINLKRTGYYGNYIGGGAGYDELGGTSTGPGHMIHSNLYGGTGQHSKGPSKGRNTVAVTESGAGLKGQERDFDKQRKISVLY